LQKLYKEDPKAVFPDPIVNLNWNYGADPDVHLVALGIVIFDLGRKLLPIYKSELSGEAH
jgi:hypothetical protein